MQTYGCSKFHIIKSYIILKRGISKNQIKNSQNHNILYTSHVPDVPGTVVAGIEYYSMLHLFLVCVIMLLLIQHAFGGWGGLLKIIFPILQEFNQKLSSNTRKSMVCVCVSMCVLTGVLFPPILMVSQIRIVVYAKSHGKEKVVFNKCQVV